MKEIDCSTLEATDVLVMAPDASLTERKLVQFVDFATQTSLIAATIDEHEVFNRDASLATISSAHSRDVRLGWRWLVPTAFALADVVSVSSRP